MDRHPQELTYPVNGEWLTFRELSAKYNVAVATLKYRHYFLGWEGEKLVQPTREGTFSYKGKLYGRYELAKLLGISPCTVVRRWKKGLREEQLANNDEPVKRREITLILDDLVARTGIKRKTLEQRYRNGERGAMLERPTEDSREQKRAAVNRRWAKVREQQEKAKNELN